MAIPSLHTYSEFVYSIEDRYPHVLRSTLVLATIGRTIAKLEGLVFFEGDIVLDVWELIDLETARIRKYSYEFYQAGEKIRWYDPFEHPDIPELASTHPHHMHVPPDIKHNRIPAPGISFEDPNLPHLLQVVEKEILSTSCS